MRTFRFDFTIQAKTPGVQYYNVDGCASANYDTSVYKSLNEFFDEAKKTLLAETKKKNKIKIEVGTFTYCFLYFNIIEITE